MYLFALLCLLLAPQQSPDHSDKRCVVVKFVAGGSLWGCGGWKVPAGEEAIVPAEVNKKLKLGDVLYFVWKQDLWVAEVRNNILCTNTGEDRAGIILNCNDLDQSVLHIPIGEWPPEWHGPELGFTYEVDLNGRPVPTDKAAWQKRQQAIRENQLKELRRWRIQPSQQSGRRTR